jgi:hypothetical protein
VTSRSNPENAAVVSIDENKTKGRWTSRTVAPGTAIAIAGVQGAISTVGFGIGIWAAVTNAAAPRLALVSFAFAAAFGSLGLWTLSRRSREKSTTRADLIRPFLVCTPVFVFLLIPISPLTAGIAAAVTVLATFVSTLPWFQTVVIPGADPSTTKVVEPTTPDVEPSSPSTHDPDRNETSPSN